MQRSICGTEVENLWNSKSISNNIKNKFKIIGVVFCPNTRCTPGLVLHPLCEFSNKCVCQITKKLSVRYWTNVFARYPKQIYLRDPEQMYSPLFWPKGNEHLSSVMSSSACKWRRPPNPSFSSILFPSNPPSSERGSKTNTGHTY